MALHAINPTQCDAEYKDYYDQMGGAMVPIYQGTKYQKGYGLGSIFSGLFKAAVPMLKKGAAALGKTALRTGVNIAKDAMAGKDLKAAFTDNAKLAGKDLLNKSINHIGTKLATPTVSANKKAKRKRPTLSQHKGFKRKRTRTIPSDIFT